MNKTILWSIAGVTILCIIVAIAIIVNQHPTSSSTQTMQTTPTPVQTAKYATAPSSGKCNITYDPSKKSYAQYPPLCVDPNKEYTGTISTNMGDIHIKLYTASAPLTVNSFYFLAKSGFYDGLTFHRVVDGFVIQGGDPNGDGTGGPGYTFADEINPTSLGLSKVAIDDNETQGYTYSSTLHSYHVTRGVLAMANSGANTNGSQFFIPVADESQSLDGKYTVFGEVTSGMDVVDKISKVSVDQSTDKPLQAVTITKITID